MADLLLQPAPGADEHPSLALINSAAQLPGDRRIDELSSPAAATAWMVERGLASPEAAVQEYCRGRLAGLRDDLRSVFAAHVTGGAPDARSLEAVNRALSSAPGALLLRHDPAAGFTRTAAHPVTQIVEHAMAVIAEDAVALLTGEQAALVTRCEATSCDRFLLRTHARRQWCSTRCGDRVRAARAYARKHDRVAAS
ncbi:CGNR zinc finger domain-containing protein [Arthrobacter sp. KK5.5]|uniref:CGNR zinc finger domain-containing protein n=1 Tax=Arthrobacter sp. KK5.5 TaxID=3373084 RepID=UPI003EE7E765